jgi:hypothetical protein
MVTLTQKDLDRLAVLTKRADFLAKRITEAEAGGKDLSYDKSEVCALRWIIAKVTEEDHHESTTR